MPMKLFMNAQPFLSALLLPCADGCAAGPDRVRKSAGLSAQGRLIEFPPYVSPHRLRPLWWSDSSRVLDVRGRGATGQFDEGRPTDTAEANRRGCIGYVTAATQIRVGVVPALFPRGSWPGTALKAPLRSGPNFPVLMVHRIVTAELATCKSDGFALSVPFEN
jgi:hypothetical protein